MGYVKFNRQLRLGLWALVLASLANLASRHMRTDIDLVTGLLYGAAIALMLLGIRRGRRDGSMAS